MLSHICGAKHMLSVLVEILCYANVYQELGTLFILVNQWHGCLDPNLIMRLDRNFYLGGRVVQRKRGEVVGWWAPKVLMCSKI